MKRQYNFSRILFYLLPKYIYRNISIAFEAAMFLFRH
jgi:hypothetical protein